MNRYGTAVQTVKIDQYGKCDVQNKRTKRDDQLRNFEEITYTFRVGRPSS